MSTEKLSIIVPVFNEGHQLEAALRSFMKVEFKIPIQWIWVDDASTDGSRAILQRLSKEFANTSEIQVISQDRNYGKGAAIRKGISAANGDFIAIQDADFEYDPRELNRLVQPLVENQTDVVYGSRFRSTSQQVHRTYHYLVNYILTSISNFLSGIYLTDMESCYKIFRSDLLKCMQLKSNRFGFEVEVTAYLAKIRPRIYELPISYYPRSKLQGKKIGWQDGFAALFHLLRFNCFTSTDEAFKNLPEHYQSGYLKSPTLKQQHRE